MKGLVVELLLHKWMDYYHNDCFLREIPMTNLANGNLAITISLRFIFGCDFKKIRKGSWSLQKLSSRCLITKA